jgi:hypothetical protein
VLPTIILVESGESDESRVAIRSATNASFRFDQIAALYELIGEARPARSHRSTASGG